MYPLYLYLLLGSVSVPLVFSVFILDIVHKWKAFLSATFFVACYFLVWDYFFTKAGIWGFNHDYCVGLFFLGMPLEEWLFFFLIPFCSLFIHFALFYKYPALAIAKPTTIMITCILMVLSLVLVISNKEKAYTIVNFSTLFAVLVFGLKWHVKLLQQFYLSFLLIVIPFIIVNGVLTGAVTEKPIVWYNDAHNLGIRFVSIPIEDFGYAFSMLFSNLILFNIFKRWG